MKDYTFLINLMLWAPKINKYVIYGWIGFTVEAFYPVYVIIRQYFRHFSKHLIPPCTTP
jgi:hypothetical protein